jgi:hypothetical protein
MRSLWREWIQMIRNCCIRYEMSMEGMDSVGKKYEKSMEGMDSEKEISGKGTRSPTRKREKNFQISPQE